MRFSCKNCSMVEFIYLVYRCINDDTLILNFNCNQQLVAHAIPAPRKDKLCATLVLLRVMFILNTFGVVERHQKLTMLLKKSERKTCKHRE